MLLAGRIDLALVSSPVRDRRLVVTPIFEDELVVIVAPTHPFARQTHVRPADMKGETLLVYPPREESSVLNDVLLPAGAVPGRVEEVMLTEAITELVKAELGVSVIARWAVKPLLASGALVARRCARRTKPPRRICRRCRTRKSSTIRASTDPSCRAGFLGCASGGR